LRIHLEKNLGARRREEKEEWEEGERETYRVQSIGERLCRVSKGPSN
jgi:hypothetical protein